MSDFKSSGAFAGENNPFASEEITAPFNTEWEAKRRVANALRSLTEVLVTSSPSVEDTHAIAQKLENTAAELSSAQRIYGRADWANSGEHGSYGQVSLELNPVAGMSNPIAPPINVWFEGEVAHATCECGWRYEGPPASVHGGTVSAIFDQFLGMAQYLSDQPGMTAYLKVDYHRRTPLNTRLNLVGEFVSIAARKNTIRAEMFADGVKTASAEALFVQPRGGMNTLIARGSNTKAQSDEQ